MKLATRATVLVPWLALVMSLLGWLFIGSSSDNVWLFTSIALAPLVVVFPGLWRGSTYVVGWLLMMAVIYFSIGFMEAFANPASRAWGSMVTITAIWLFVAAILFIRRHKYPG